MASDPVLTDIRNMIDLAIGSPEVGVVDFCMLHTVLHCLAQQLRVLDKPVELRGSAATLPTAVGPAFKDNGQTVAITEYIVDTAADSAYKPVPPVAVNVNAPTSKFPSSDEPATILVVERVRKDYSPGRGGGSSPPSKGPTTYETSGSAGEKGAGGHGGGGQGAGRQRSVGQGAGGHGGGGQGAGRQRAADYSQSGEGTTEESDRSYGAARESRARESSIDKLSLVTLNKFTELEDVVQDLKNRVYGTTPKNEEILHEVRSQCNMKAITEMWTNLNVSSRLEAAEVGLGKLSSLIEDLIREIGRGTVISGQAYPAQAQAGQAAAFAAPGGQAPAFAAPGGQAQAFAAPGGQAPAYAAPGGQGQAFAAPGGQAPAFAAPGGQAPAYAAPGGQAPAFAAPGGQAAAFAAPGGQGQAFAAPGGQAQAFVAPGGQAPAYAAPGGQAPAFAAPDGQAPAFAAPGGQAAAFAAPGGQGQAFAAPGGQAPAFATPGGQAQAFAAPGGQAPGFAAPGGQAPAFAAPGGQAQAFTAPGGQAPAFAAPGGQAPAVAAPGGQAPAGAAPASSGQAAHAAAWATPASPGQATPAAAWAAPGSPAQATCAVVGGQPQAYAVQQPQWQPPPQVLQAANLVAQLGPPFPWDKLADELYGERVSVLAQLNRLRSDLDTISKAFYDAMKSMEGGLDPKAAASKIMAAKAAPSTEVLPPLPPPPAPPVPTMQAYAPAHAPAQGMPAATQYASAAPQFAPGTPQYAPAAPQHAQAAPQHAQAAPQYAPAAPQHAPGAPQHDAAAPQYAPAAAQYAQGAAQYAQGAPQHESAASQYAPSAAQYAPGTPQYAPVAPQCAPGAPQYAPGAPQYAPGAPQYGPGALQYAPGAPQYAPGVAQYAPGAPGGPVDCRGARRTSASTAALMDRLAQLERRVQECCDSVGKSRGTAQDQLNNFQDQLDKLRHEVAKLQDDFSALKISPNLAKDLEGLMQLYKTVQTMQEQLRQVNETARLLAGEKDERQHHMNSLLEQIEILKTIKLDREDMAEAMAEKADLRLLARKVSHDQFEMACDDLSRGLEHALGKLNSQESLWQQVLDDIQREIETKLDKMELSPLKEYFSNKLRQLQDNLKQMASMRRDVEAAGTTRRLLRDVNCISCDAKAVMAADNTGTAPSKPLPAHFSIKPYLSYELDAIRKTQASNLQQRNLHDWETIDKQMAPKPPVKVRSETDKHICNRYCGGSHTTTTPAQRVARVGHFIKQWGPEVVPLSSGLAAGDDGRLYKVSTAEHASVGPGGPVDPAYTKKPKSVPDPPKPPPKPSIPAPECRCVDGCN